jgi:hypothetical protein
MRVQFVASSGEGQFEFRACIAAATYIHAYEVLQLAYVLQTKLRFFLSIETQVPFPLNHSRCRDDVLRHGTNIFAPYGDTEV